MLSTWATPPTPPPAPSDSSPPSATAPTPAPPSTPTALPSAASAHPPPSAQRRDPPSSARASFNADELTTEWPASDPLASKIYLERETAPHGDGHAAVHRRELLEVLDGFPVGPGLQITRDPTNGIFSITSLGSEKLRVAGTVEAFEHGHASRPLSLLAPLFLIPR